MLISVDKLTPDPQNVRAIKASSDADAQLTESIRALGVVQAIAVRPHPEHEDHYLIVAGERRWRCAQAAGVPEVPCVLHEGLNPLGDSRIRAMQAAENMARAGMNPVDQWRTMKALADENGYTVEGAAAAIGVSPALGKRLHKLGSLHPALLDDIGGGRLPDDEHLTKVANAPLDKQQDALSSPNSRRRDGTLNWSNLATLCTVKAIPLNRAIFDPKDSGVAFQEDVFAEPGSDDQFTTTDIAGFLTAQRAALDTLAEKHRKKGREFFITEPGQYGSAPKAPAGWDVTWKEPPKRWAADDKGGIVACIEDGWQIGEVLMRVCTRKPEALSKGRAGDATESGGTSAEAEKKERPPITLAGQDLLAKIKTDVLREHLRTHASKSGSGELLALLLLALAGNNVSVQGAGSGGFSSFGFKDLAGHILTGGEDVRAAAAEAVARMVTCSGPRSFRASGAAAEWVGQECGATMSLPRFDTPEFLACCSGSLIRELAKEAGVDGATVKAMRERLVGKLPNWRPPGAQFEAPPPTKEAARDSVPDEDGEEDEAEIEGELDGEPRAAPASAEDDGDGEDGGDDEGDHRYSDEKHGRLSDHEVTGGVDDITADDIRETT